MKVSTGDTFQIRARYDNGGYPYLRVTHSVGRHFWTVPLNANFEQAWNHNPRGVKFTARCGLTARQRLAKYWKRVTPPQPEKPNAD